MAYSKARCTLLSAMVLAALGAPSPAGAAEVTRVATAAEVDNPFDLDLNIGFARTQRRGKITREWHQPDAQGNMHVADVIELRYYQESYQMPMRLAIGVFNDLELHVGASLVLSDHRTWGYPAADTTDRNSTVHNNCINPDGTLIAGCDSSSGTNTAPLFAVPGNAYRAGLSNITVGVSWAPFNDAIDDTKPKWVIGFDYAAPSATVGKPYEATSDGKPGGIGDGAHRFNFMTALSKRLGAIDPYVRLTYSLPSAGPLAYSNCDNGDLLGYPGNCSQGPWTRSEIGLQPPHVGGLTFGAEFFPYDDGAKHQAVGIDLQFGAMYVSEGRTYNELSDALGKLLYTEDYMTLGGSLGVYARPAEYVQLKLNASLYHDTEHFLTNEPVGRDLDGACRGNTSSKCVDLDNKAGEVNPTFDARYDMPGRRFRISEVNVFTVMATGVVNF